MSHTHKKSSGPPSALRVPSRSSSGASGSASGSRSSSHKKSSESGGQSGSRKKAAARAWDDSIHDLSVHKLPKQKQMEKQLKRLSRQQLGQIAAMPMPPSRMAAVVRAVDALSPRQPERHLQQQQQQQQQQPRRQRDSSSSRRSSSQPRVRSRSRSRSRSPSASSFSSPHHDGGEWDGSSIGSTPESRSSSVEENESAASTPSPHQQRVSRQQPLQQQQRTAPLVHSAKPQVPRQNRPANKEQQSQAPMQAAPSVHAPLSRHVAAPVVTSAPPSQENSDDENDNDSFSAFAPAAGSASTATMANYSPWLKPNHMLSPVLERSISDSAASTPNAHAQQQQQQQQLSQLRSVQEEPTSTRYSQAAHLQMQSQGLDRPFFTDSDSSAPSNSQSPARSADRRAVVHQSTEQQAGTSNRNLLAELRHSLDAPLRDSDAPQQGSTLSSMPLPTLQHFLSLMSTLASHLSEREAVAAKEAQFKNSTVASLSGCNAQLKALTARLDEVERENRAMKAAALQQSLEHEKSMHAVQQQVRTLEQRLEQMALAPQQQHAQMQMHGQSSAPTHAYNPTLYHSQHLSHSALPTPALSHSSSSSSIYGMHASAQIQQLQQQHAAASRAPSPPRPIVINHSTNAATVAAPGRGYAGQQQQQQQQLHPSSSQQSPAPSSFGSRTSEVNVHVADGGFRPTVQMAMGPRPAASASVAPVPAHKMAWQAAKSAQQQQQQQQQQQPMPQSQMRPQTAPHGAMRHPSAQQQQQQQQQQPVPSSRFHSTLSDAVADDDLDGSGDLEDEAPRDRMATAAHAAAVGRFAPFSPGSEQDEEEARQFAQQAAKMRAQTVAFGAIQGRQPQQQQPPHAQQQQQLQR